MSSSSVDTRVSRVPPWQVSMVWPFVRAWLERAVQYNSGEQTIDDVRVFCEHMDAELWLITVDGALRGCGVTQIQKPVLQILYVGGDGVRDWPYLRAKLAEWARHAGCTRLRFKGRRGWARLLSADGWRQSAIEMEVAT